MKKSQDITGLPVFSVINGKEVGQVKDLVINPEEGAVEFLLIEGGNWFMGARVLPFRSVMGIGQHAVTVESEAQLTSLSEASNVSALLQRGIKVKENKVLTKSGNLVGIVTEFEVDEKTGRVTSLTFKYLEENAGEGTLKAAQVLTYGRDVLVIEEEIKGTDPVEKAPAVAVSPEPVRDNEASRLFIERQKQFLLGRKVIQDVKDDQGNILIAGGTIIDEAALQIAEASGKLVELSQNAR